MSIFKIILLIASVLMPFANVNGIDYFVSPDGSNQNRGISSDKPAKFIQRVVDIANPGDQIFLMNGVHIAQDITNDSPVVEFKLKNSGTSKAPILLTNYPEHEPLIKFDSWEGIKISGASYITISNIKIQGNREQISLLDAQKQPIPLGSSNCNEAEITGAISKYNGQGILIVGPRLEWSPLDVTTVPHHIKIVNCEVFDCSSSGIAAQQADYITIESCKIHHNCWYTIFGTSGINFYQLVNTDGTETQHNDIHRNLVYENKLLVDPVTTECNRFDGNGIILDDFRHDQVSNYRKGAINYGEYTAWTIVSHNIVVQNGGSGISVFKSNRISIINNTSAYNGTYLSENLNPGNLALGSFSEIFVKNNILYNPNFRNDSEDSISHAIYLYQSEDDFIGEVKISENILFGGFNSSLPVNCEDCFSQYDPNFENIDPEADKPFLPLNKSFAKYSLEQGNKDFIGNRVTNELVSIGAINTFKSTYSCNRNNIKVSFFPNPVNEKLSVLSDNEYTVDFISYNGEIQNTVIINEPLQVLDLDYLNVGVYTIRFTAPNGVSCGDKLLITE